MGGILACSLYPEMNGRTLTSRYAITSKHLGKGAFAVVREGIELDTEMPVAVKIIQKKGIGSTCSADYLHRDVFH